MFEGEAEFQRLLSEVTRDGVLTRHVGDVNQVRCQFGEKPLKSVVRVDHERRMLWVYVSPSPPRFKQWPCRSPRRRDLVLLHYIAGKIPSAQ